MFGRLNYTASVKIPVLGMVIGSGIMFRSFKKFNFNVVEKSVFNLNYVSQTKSIQKFSFFVTKFAKYLRFFLESNFLLSKFPNFK